MGLDKEGVHQADGVVLADAAAFGIDGTQARSRERHWERTIWQRRFWEHQIRDERDYKAHVDYVHFNPVRHGLVKSPKDWLYSTFHRYVAQQVYDESWGFDGSVVLAENVGWE